MDSQRVGGYVALRQRREGFNQQVQGGLAATESTKAAINVDQVVQDAFNALSDGSFSFQAKITVTSTDGTKIDGNVMIPNGGNANSRYPAIVFCVWLGAR
ncbi:MAG: hypothetical protein U1F16_10080 [Turneriella sp.]